MQSSTKDREQLRDDSERRALFDAGLHWIGHKAKGHDALRGIAIETATVTAGLIFVLDDTSATSQRSAAVQLSRQLWSGQRISFQGRYFQTTQLKLYDPPPSPPPIFVAAGGPKSAHLAGQYGDGWITEAGGVKNQRLVAAFNQGARNSGRDPATYAKAVQAVLDAGATPFLHFAQRDERRIP